MKLYFTMIFIMLSALLFSATYTVAQDGTGDYTVIQTAVDAANAGDTIRVYPGRYYENILIRKNLAVVSNYEYTNNDEDITSTILDGNFLEAIFKIYGTTEEPISGYICGFTIMNGTGNHYGGTYARVTIGGGIYANRMNELILKKNIIKNNSAYIGGGIYSRDTDLILKGNVIKNNEAFIMGGGITLSNSILTFDPSNLNSLFLNYAPLGSDLFKGAQEDTTFEVIVDTFTVMEPDYYYVYTPSGNPGFAYVEDNTVYSIEHNKIDRIEHDLYLSPTGDDENDGLTPQTPMKTIALALSKIKADSLHPRTIHLANGVYSTGMNHQFFPLHMRAYVSLIGESKEQTIIDAENRNLTILAGREFREDTTNPETSILKNYKIRNITFLNGSGLFLFDFDKNHNCEISNIDYKNCIDGEGWIMQFINSDTKLENISITDSYVSAAIRECQMIGETNIINSKISNIHSNPNPDLQAGDGISTDGYMGFPLHTLNLINCEFSFIENSDDDDPIIGNVVQIMYGNVNIINCTIANNSILLSDGGAILLCIDPNNLSIYNSILWHDIPREIFIDNQDNNTQNLYVSNSLVEGGEWNIGIIGSANIDWDDATNLDTDPLFDTTGRNPFALTSLSPCIDAGTLDLPDGIELPETDLAGNPRIVGNSVDMGAYEYQGHGSYHENIIQTPQSTLITVYPNPFSISKSGIKSSVKIKLELAQAGKIELSIYNLKGQKVKELITAETASGIFNAHWDVKNESSKEVATGVYFVKLTENGKVTRVSRFTIVK